MSTIEKLRLEVEIHNNLVEVVESAMQWMVEEDHDPEDGVWKELNEVLEARSIMIANLISKVAE